MSWHSWFTKERKIWHKRFIPSLVTGLAVAIITLFFELTTSNIVLFSSLGASASIMTHNKIHELTILRTVVSSYLIALTVSLLVGIGISYGFSSELGVMVTVSITLILLYLFNIFHPPAVSASLAFLILEGGFAERIMVFIAVIILLIITKLLTYMFFYENLELRKFHLEFKKIFKK